MSAGVARQLVISSRPVSWINTAYPFAAAYLLTTRQVDLVLIVGTVFFLVPYNLAMYGINDVFDYESDLRNPRKGGAHGAVLDRRLHRTTLSAAALSCLPFVVFLVAVGSPAAENELAVGFFGSRYERATPGEREYLRAMADLAAQRLEAGEELDEVESVATADIATHLGRKPQSLSPARDALLKKGLIYSGERGRIAFTVPHFGRYLRAQT